MSKKGMEPSCFCSSVVNCMAGSTEFMCCRNSYFLSCFKMTNVSFINLFHHLGGSLQLIGLCLQTTPYINWPAQDLLEIPWQPLGLLIVLTLKQEISIAQAKLKQVQDVLNGHGGSVVELFILFQLLLNHFYCRLHWDRCKEGSHII